MASLKSFPNRKASWCGPVFAGALLQEVNVGASREAQAITLTSAGCEK